MPPVEKKDAGYLSLDEVPSDPFSVDESITKKIFWDPVAHRPFVIQAADVNMCRNFGVALPNMYYTRRLRENFSWMPFS